jgi:large subunit ribosomal protein L10
MRPEKVSIANEVRTRLTDSPYVILTDFTGLTVDGFSELRGRLKKANARAMVVKNSLVRNAFKELNYPDLNGAFHGPTAVVYGNKDVAAAAGVLKTFIKEFKKLKIKGGVLDKAMISASDIETIADLPPREVLQAQLLGVLSAPATKLVRLLNTPASQLVQVLQAKSEKAA